MREILFRGKRVDNGEWVEGFYTQIVQCPLPEYINELRNKFITIEDRHKYLIRHIIHMLTNAEKKVIPETVGQFTGLTDKNGKKIFEGDIVAVEGFIERAFIIIYYNGGFKLKEIGSEDLFAYYITETMVEEELIEVIGNIHDNPELIERRAKNAT